MKLPDNKTNVSFFFLLPCGEFFLFQTPEPPITKSYRVPRNSSLIRTYLLGYPRSSYGSYICYMIKYLIALILHSKYLLLHLNLYRDEYHIQGNPIREHLNLLFLYSYNHKHYIVENWRNIYLLL